MLIIVSVLPAIVRNATRGWRLLTYKLRRTLLYVRLCMLCPRLTSGASIRGFRGCTQPEHLPSETLHEATTEPSVETTLKSADVTGYPNRRINCFGPLYDRRNKQLHRKCKCLFSCCPFLEYNTSHFPTLMRFRLYFICKYLIAVSHLLVEV